MEEVRYTSSTPAPTQSLLRAENDLVRGSQRVDLLLCFSPFFVKGGNLPTMSYSIAFSSPQPPLCICSAFSLLTVV
jgi:hypothetical protein